jgi:MFS family permease
VKLPDVVGPLRERDFRLFFTGHAVSAIGYRFTQVAMAFAVLDLTGSVADVGYVFAARTITVVAFLLVGGVWADRLERRRVMLTADVVRGCVQWLAALLLVTGGARLWHLIALQGVYGVAQAFYDPASTGLIPQIISPGRLQQANSMRGLSRSASAIFGPALAGVLVVAAGPGWALAVDGTSFFVSAGCLARLRLPPREAQPRTSFLSELREGWSEFRSRTWVWTSVAYFSFFQMGVLPAFFVLGPFIAQRSLGGASSWALILSAAGIGSIVGGVVGLHFHPRRPLLAAFVLLLLWTPQLILLAVGAPTVAVAACALGGSCSLSLGNTFWYTSLQRHVPAHALARVSAYDWFGSLLFVPAGYALVGPVAEVIGVKATLLGSAAGLLLATSIVCGTKSVRTLGLRDARTDETRAETAAQTSGY